MSAAETSEQPLHLEQRRAKAAYDSVRTLTQNRDEYKSLAKNLPAMIMSSGLPQTLAFLQASDGTSLIGYAALMPLYSGIMLRGMR
jgi:CRISPR/Cas system CMR-associated protein Cmr5 small subunit